MSEDHKVSPLKLTLWGVVAFSVMGLILFANALENPFHYDDLHSIQYNPHIRTLKNIPIFFTDTQTFSSDGQGTMFRPLLLVSYAFNYYLDGQNVVGYRLVNLGLHIACAVLLSVILVRLQIPQRMAWGLGTLFLLHPVHGEPVNYISSRSDLLVSFACLGVFYFGLDASQRYWRIYSAFGGALLVKSIAIVLPPIMAIYYWGKNTRMSIWRRPFPMLGGMTLAYIGILYSNNFLASSLAKAPRSLDVQLLTQVKAYIYYLWLFSMPVKLSVELSFLSSSELLSGPVLAAGAFLASLLFLSIKGYKDLRGFGFLWYVVALAPTALVPLNIFVSQSRLYLASAGLFLVLAGMLWQMPKIRRQRLGIWAGLLGVVFAFSVVRQNQVWATPLTLWQDAVAKGPGMFRAQMNLALAYAKEGDDTKALHHLDIALKIKPDYADAWAERGNILNNIGDLDAAFKAYSKALEYRPDMAGVYYNRGNLYLRTGRLLDAEKQYRLALERNSNFAKVYNNWGQLDELQGEAEKAFNRYQQALEIDPDMAEAWFNLAVLAEQKGKRQLALEGYEKTYSLLLKEPDFSRNEMFRQFAQRALEAQKRLGQ